MPYSNDIYLEAKERIAERRMNALRNADYTREQLYHEFPRVREIDTELRSIGASVAKCVLKSNDPDDIRRLSERSLSLQEERKAVLTEAGLSVSVLEPHYFCEKCGDTGMIELENRTVVCDCMNSLMAQIAGEKLNADLPLKDCTFERFRLDYYSDKPDQDGRVPLNRMSKILNYCREYADNFSTKSKSLLMRGATGLGKTHLSLAIANEVIKKGFSVIYVTAPEIINRLEREHFSYQQGREDSLSTLLKCDLLILDDLGTEFSTQFSVSCVYNLINSRMLAHKPTVISTNLTLTELVSVYSQRFVSRLIGECDKLDFIGSDNRVRRIIP